MASYQELMAAAKRNTNGPAADHSGPKGIDRKKVAQLKEEILKQRSTIEKIRKENERYKEENAQLRDKLSRARASLSKGSTTKARALTYEERLRQAATLQKRPDAAVIRRLDGDPRPNRAPPSQIAQRHKARTVAVSSAQKGRTSSKRAALNSFEAKAMLPVSNERRDRRTVAQVEADRMATSKQRARSSASSLHRKKGKAASRDMSDDDSFDSGDGGGADSGSVGALTQEDLDWEEEQSRRIGEAEDEAELCKEKERQRMKKARKQR